MALLVKDLATFKIHVTTNYNFDYDIIAIYLKKVDRSQIKPIVGRALYAAYTAIAPTTENPKEVMDLLEEASSNLAMFEATKVLAVSISDSGLFVSSSPNAVPADWASKRDLRRYLLQTGQQALDEALEIMDSNPTDFPLWVGTPGYSKFKELFTRQTSHFQRYFNINNSRLAFLRLRPSLLKVENKYFMSFLGAETVFQIKQGAAPEEIKALELCRAAQVPLCISEMAREGFPNLSADAFYVAIDEIPGEKKQVLGEGEFRNLSQTKQDDGLEQIKILVEYLRNNPTVFSLFAAKEVAATPNPTQNTGSIVSFM